MQPIRSASLSPWRPRLIITGCEKKESLKMVRRFIIDTDAGLDDASALFLATEAHKTGIIEIIAITAVHGNTEVDNVVKNVSRVTTAAGLNKIPIFKGAFTSLVDPHDNTDPYHGVDGFGDALHDAEADLSQVEPEHAVSALVRLVKECPNQITLVALGPLTNIAMAMRIDASFANNLKELYIMGGNTEGTGNITASAEFNFHCDPEAAYIVLNNARCQTFIVPWELCLYKSTLEWDWRVNIYGSVPSPQGQLMNLIEQRVITKRKFTNYVACDQLAMAAAIDRRVVAEQTSHFVTVELSGKHTRGLMIVDRFEHFKRQPNVVIIEKLNMELFKAMMVWSLGANSSSYIPLEPAMN